MNLRHDAQGFLLGDRITPPPADGSKPALAVLKSVRRDVFLIRRLMESTMGRAGSLRSVSRGQGAAQAPAPAPAVEWVGRRSAAAQIAHALSRSLPGSERGPVVAPRPRDARGRFVSMQTEATGDERGRDAQGRFKAEGGSEDRAESNIMDRIAGSLEEIGAAATGAGNIDPAIAAIKEVADVVSPVGRGIVALHNRAAERKRDRWYGRILKAITGRNGEAGGGGAGVGGEVRRGSFYGTMLGELAGRLVEWLGAAAGGALRALGAAAGGALGVLGKVLSRVFLPVAAAWGSWELGKWVGGKIYEWLDKSGIAAKVFDAFDAVGAWFKEKWGAAKDAANQAAEAAKQAANQAAEAAKRTARDARLGYAEARHTPLDPEARREARLDSRGAAPDSAAYKAGAVAGTMMRGVDVAGGAIKRLIGVQGTKRIFEKADGTVEERDGGSVSWRNNNPGNLKFEHAGSADKTVKSRRTREQALAAAQRQYEGVVDLDQFGNAIFATEQQGRAAKAKLLLGRHGGSTVEQMLPKYAINDYSGTANHGAYAAGIYKGADAKGLNLRGKKIGDMSPQEVDALLDGMKRVEGFKVGTVKGIGAASVPAVASATMPAIKPAAVPMPVPERPDVTPAAPVPERLGGTERNRPVVIVKDEVGQDVRSRPIANIVTGGLGG